MQECWYSDNRDLVKWAALAHLSEAHGVKTLVQALYLSGPPRRPSVSYASGSFIVSDAVWNHFRSLANIRRLAEEIHVDIEIVEDKMDQRNRDAYTGQIECVVRRSARPRLLFLDPDTGLAPSKWGNQHVTTTELKRLWDVLGNGDWLVVYQHARRKKGWLDDVCREVRLALPNARDIEVFRSNDRGLQDSALFAANKHDEAQHV